MHHASTPGSDLGPAAKEQDLVANIQELQRQLFQVKTEQHPLVEEDKGDILQGVSHHKLIVVSNRLPVSGTKDSAGEWKFTMSSGGLVTALQGVRDEFPFVWIGWFGQEIPENEQPVLRERLFREFNLLPVFLDDELAELHYNGFCNDILWPLFHYVPLPMYRPGGEKRFDKTMWEAYKRANDKFARVVRSAYEDGDFVWVHDFHLMMLPKILRNLIPTCKIGFFLHTPFPSSEIYRVLPVRHQLLRGLLAADLCGFHTYDYARHFLSSCQRIAGCDASPKGVFFKNRFLAVGVFPIGIDPEYLMGTLERPSTQARIKHLNSVFEGKKIVLGVDRVDYIKGMPHKLLAIEKFFTQYPEWLSKVVFIQIGIPSRVEVEEYKTLARKVHELVGRINGSFGTLEYTPIHYMVSQRIDVPRCTSAILFDSFYSTSPYPRRSSLHSIISRTSLLSAP
jgi:trehalose-6-phosphate synthase